MLNRFQSVVTYLGWSNFSWLVVGDIVGIPRCKSAKGKQYITITSNSEFKRINEHLCNPTWKKLSGPISLFITTHGKVSCYIILQRINRATVYTFLLNLDAISFQM